MDPKQILEKAEHFKGILQLNKGIWKDIDPYLLILAFTHTSGIKLISKDIQRYQKQKYGYKDYEHFEYQGDRVLEIIITTYLMERKDLRKISDIQKTKEYLVSNATLKQKLERKNICSEVFKTSSNKKICSDVFEAILGVLYYHGFYVKNLNYCVLNHLKDWLFDIWNIEECVSNLLDYGQEVNDEFEN
jgi:dsRNA-specific ribonuclease